MAEGIDPSDPSKVRVGNEERTAALDRLGDHFAKGYLDLSEFEERTAQAAVARTRADLAALFGDMPGGEETSISTPELDDMLVRKKKLDRALGVLWSLTMVLFFVGLFALGWDYFWVVFPIAGLASWGLYEFYGISDEEDEVLEEIMEDERLSRAERLRIEKERRKELGMWLDRQTTNTPAVTVDQRCSGAGAEQRGDHPNGLQTKHHVAAAAEQRAARK